MVGINKQHTADTNDTSYLRKIRKPIVERKRRERMNQSVTQLRSLIDNTIKQQVSPMTRVDKADILELTVCHLTQLQQQQRKRVSMTPDDTAAYASGYKDCLREVTNFLLNNRLIDDGRMTDLSHHLHVTFNRSTKRFVSEKGRKVSTPQQHFTPVNILNEAPYEIRKISPIYSHSNYGNSIHVPPTGSCLHEQTFMSPYLNGSSTPSTGSELLQDSSFNSSVCSSLNSTPNSSSRLSEYSPIDDKGAFTRVAPSSSADRTPPFKSCFTSECDITGSTYGGDRTVSIGTGNENKIGHMISESTWRPW